MTPILEKQIAYLEENGILVDVFEDEIGIDTNTDAGGDMYNSFYSDDCKDLRESMIDYYENYDVNGEVLLWWQNGTPEKSVPFTNVRDHYNDLEKWRSEMLAIAEKMPAVSE